MIYKYYYRVFFCSCLIATLGLLISGCAGKKYTVAKVSVKYNEVNTQLDLDTEIERFLKPYKEHIASDLSQVLAYNPQNLDKTNGNWQNGMTNFYADAILEIAQPIFKMRTGEKIDFCLLNYGGIRANIPQGSITTKTAYDIMPFENSAVVLKITGETVYELSDFIIKNKIAHPLSGIEIFVDKHQRIIKILINGVALQKNQIYYVVTNNYLAQGGDRMSFFTKAIEEHPLDYKLRNMFIAYFNTIDTLKPSVKPRIIFE